MTDTEWGQDLGLIARVATPRNHSEPAAEVITMTLGMKDFHQRPCSSPMS